MKIFADIELSDDEYDIVKNALEIMDQDINRFLKNALMSRAVHEITLLHKGVAGMRISQAVQDMMKANAAATEWHEKVQITKGKIFDKTGSNRQTIARFFNENQRLIDEHHKQMGITDPLHNMRVGQKTGFKRRN